MRVGVEVADGQLFHALEELLAKLQLGALRNVDHQSVVGVGADDTRYEYQPQFEERLQKRGVFRVVHLRERHDIVIDERLGEKRGGQRCDGREDDAEKHGGDIPFVVLHDDAEQSNERVLLVLVEGCREVLSTRPSLVAVEVRLSHLSKSPVVWF